MVGLASQPTIAYDKGTIPVPSRVPTPGADHECTRPAPCAIPTGGGYWSMKADLLGTGLR